MNRWGLLVVVTCVLAAGCDDSSTGPSNPPLVFSALLSPANEVPPIGNAESSGRGAVQITFDVTRDSANVITAGTAAFHFQVSGFPASTTVVGAHIHPGAAGINGPVIVSTGVTATEPVSLSNGTASFDVSGITVPPATIQSIVNNPAGFYFNIHSPLNPGGFARGQLARVQ
jgi:hypothetical protein